LVLLVGAVVGVAALGGVRMYAQAEARAKALAVKQARTEALANLHGLAGRWRDADSLAKATPRAGLSGPVGALQAIRQEVVAVRAAGCAAEAQAALSSGMGTMLGAFMSFMSSGVSRDEFADSEAMAELKFSEYVSQAAACSQK
jgi:hypothetical protein